MTNHPGRKPGSAGPDPELIRRTRDAVCQTQAQAGAVVCATERTRTPFVDADLQPA